MLVSGRVQAPPDKLRSSYLVMSYVAKRIANIRLTIQKRYRKVISLDEFTVSFLKCKAEWERPLCITIIFKKEGDREF